MMKKMIKVNIAFVGLVLAILICSVGISFANTNNVLEAQAPISEPTNLIVFGLGLISVGVIIRKMKMAGTVSRQLRTNKNSFEASKHMAS